ncbi:MAG: hypothetical protein IAF94_02305 [Pirellulaceae bacterium]|nr:hypothetical protein [Pirellulaceae bacterium]
MSRLSYFGFAALIAGLVLTTSLSAQGRRGGAFGGAGRSLINLAAIEAVQKEIGVTDDQKAKLTALGTEYREESQKVRTEAGITGGGGGERPTEEQVAKMTEGMKKLNESFAGKLKETLKPEQLERVQQISYQAAGSAAYSNPDVVKALDITKEQQDKLTTISNDFREKMRALFAGGGGDGNREAFTKLNDEQNAEIAKVITAEQTEKFTKLKGNTFDVSTLGGRGGPGGGRPGGKGRPEKKVD